MISYGCVSPVRYRCEAVTGRQLLTRCIKAEAKVARVLSKTPRSVPHPTILCAPTEMFWKVFLGVVHSFLYSQAAVQ